MYNNRHMPIRVCAFGFDARSFSALQLFFRGKCSDKVALVGDDEAEIGIIDMDSYNAARIYSQQEQRHPGRLFILLSLENRENPRDNAIYVKKPVQIQHMLDALSLVSSRLIERSTAINQAPVLPKSVEAERPAEVRAKEKPRVADAPKQAVLLRKEKVRNANHTATLLDERGFGEYIGSMKDIDFSNPVEVCAAQYDPKRYFQGYLQSAYKAAIERHCRLRLNTGWKPVTIFPDTREVWVDADDHQLRAFCLVPVHSISELDFTDTSAGVMTMSPASSIAMDEKEYDLAKFQHMDSLMWKVALWTSAGRIPEDIDLTRPVYLEHWPNLTRLLLFPGALRIAALLSEQPRSLLDVAEALNLRQQYVFAFFSAARALGLAGQTMRQSETLVAAPPVAPGKHTGVLRKILQRLLKR